MCGLCSKDEREKKNARDHHSSMALKYREISQLHAGLAEGRIVPHSDQIVWARPKAHSILRDIVGMWL